MANAFFNVPIAVNEPVRPYAPESAEAESLLSTYRSMMHEMADIPMSIGGKDIFTGVKEEIRPPHQREHLLGHFHRGQAEHVTQAIDAALAARQKWSRMPWESRAAIFLKAADLLAGPFRDRMNAATMLCQSKNAFQAEIDAACEMADFFRFNVQYMTEIYKGQPESAPGIWNRMEYRPLEGFVFALSPFNFTSIAANLTASPVLMGNVTVWKPANTQIYSAQVIMEVFKAAGLPDGVVNLVFVSGPVAGEVIFAHPDFAGIHYTGSTSVFKGLWKKIGSEIDTYKAYPRIVGETGGKDFVVAHPSAEPQEVVTALSRGAFEYQGQKCSAASRAYLPASLWPEIKEGIIKDVSSFKMGRPDDFSNFINAVIDQKAFDKISSYIDHAKASADAEIIVGGGYDDSQGYFIEPTVVVTSDPKYKSMVEEIFGPVLTIYVYEDAHWQRTLELVDSTSEYALTGAIFSKDRYAAEEATRSWKMPQGISTSTISPQVPWWVSSPLAVRAVRERTTRRAPT